jgi:hypothetical protein
LVEEIGDGAHATTGVKRRTALYVKMPAQVAHDLAHKIQRGGFDGTQPFEHFLPQFRAKQTENLG